MISSVKRSRTGRRFQVNRIQRRLRLDVSQLNVGMHIVELDRPWIESPFLFQGFTLETADDVQMVQDVCKYVYVDVVEEEWKEQEGHSSSGRKITRTRFAEKKLAARELNAANRTYQHARQHVKALLSNVLLGRALSMKDTQKVVNECVDRVIHNPNAILWLTRLKHQDEYTAEHSINVSLLAIALGRHMELERWELENLGVCGLLHDIGKMRVPNEILNKPDVLTPEEFAEMANHTTYARQLLMGRTDIYPGAVDVAYTHHERLDGKGYPRGIDGAKISLFTRIVTVVDAYDAMTSDRCYKEGISSLDALKVINRHKGTQFDEEVAQKFIEMIGLYPPGYLIEMTNGEVGIILTHDEGYQLRPRVIMILDKDKNPQPETIINLANYPEDPQGNVYEPKGVYRSGHFDINVEDYVRKGLQIKGFDYSLLNDRT